MDTLPHLTSIDKRLIRFLLSYSGWGIGGKVSIDNLFLDNTYRFNSNSIKRLVYFHTTCNHFDSLTADIPDFIFVLFKALAEKRSCRYGRCTVLIDGGNLSKAYALIVFVLFKKSYTNLKIFELFQGSFEFLPFRGFFEHKRRF